MINTILTLAYVYVIGGLVFLPLSITTEFVVTMIKGPQFAAWVHSHIKGENDHKYSFKRHLETFFLWPILFVVWVSAMVRGRTMAQHMILLRQAAQDHKSEAQKQYEESLKRLAEAQAELEQATERRKEAEAHLRELEQQHRTQVIWSEADRGHGRVLHTRAMMFTRIEITGTTNWEVTTESDITPTHTVAKTSVGWLVFRAMPDPANNLPVALSATPEAARLWCDQDVEWIEVCYPGQETARQDLWEETKELVVNTMVKGSNEED